MQGSSIDQYTLNNKEGNAPDWLVAAAASTHNSSTNEDHLPQSGLQASAATARAGHKNSSSLTAARACFSETFCSLGRAQVLILQDPCKRRCIVLSESTRSQGLGAAAMRSACTSFNKGRLLAALCKAPRGKVLPLMAIMEVGTRQKLMRIAGGGTGCT